MTEDAPALVWLRPARQGTEPRWFQSNLDPPEPDAVEYIRKDMVEGLVRDMAAAMVKLAAMYRNEL